MIRSNATKGMDIEVKGLIRPSASALLLLFFLSMLSTSASAQEGVFFPLLLPSLSQAEPGSGNCAIGSLVADVAAFAADAQLAVINGGDLAGDIPQGVVSRENASAVFANDRGLAKTELTPYQLKGLLEQLLSYITMDMNTEVINREDSDFGGFPNVSGFTLRYDASAPAYGRVLSVTLPDGTPLDLDDTETVYSLAGSEVLLSAYLGNAYSPLDVTLSGALYAYLESEGSTLTALDWDRVTAIGTAENTLVSALSKPVLFISAAIIIAVFYLMGRRLARRPGDIGAWEGSHAS